LALMLISAAGLSVFAWRKQAEAKRQAQEAVKQKTEAQEQRIIADGLRKQAVAAQETLQSLNLELKDQTRIAIKEGQRAITQSQIAARNERRAVAALKQARELERIKTEISADEGRVSILRKEGKVKEAFALSLKILANYQLIGDKAGEQRTLDNIQSLHGP